MPHTLRQFIKDCRKNNCYQSPIETGLAGMLEDAFKMTGTPQAVPVTEYEDCSDKAKKQIEQAVKDKNMPEAYIDLYCIAVMPFLPCDIKELETLLESDTEFLEWRKNDRNESLDEYRNNAASAVSSEKGGL